jgi:hypothetical protein
MDEREVEAVARAWWARDPKAFDTLTPEWRALQMRRAEAAIVALDRVRDARGDDMTERELEDAAQWHGDARSPEDYAPSRVGSVAVEDVEKLRRLGDEMAQAILDLRMHEGRSAWDAAEIARDRWLTEFSRSSTDRPEGSL